MPKWTVEGFDGLGETDFKHTIHTDEETIRKLLDRLVARHLTEQEIVDATEGRRSDFEVSAESQAHRRTLMTTGSGHHYVARTT